MTPVTSHQMGSIPQATLSQIAAPGGACDQASTLLPPLRDELKLFQSPSDLFGWPTYTLHDLLLNKYYRIGWREFEMLARWGKHSRMELMERVEQETALVISDEHVEGLIRFLKGHHLIQAETPEDMASLLKGLHGSRMGMGHWLLHHYLFFRIKLFNPDALLQRILPWTDLFYGKWFLFFLVICGMTGLYLVSRQWDVFLQTFMYLFNLQGMLWYALALVTSKIGHELGHAMTLKRYGGRVPAMGVAFMVMVPMLYTDTSSSWEIPSRRQRVAIACSGVAVELIFAAVSLIFWALLPDGPMRTAAFLVATITLVGTLVINANPFMRFDGYWVLSDWMGIPNLHERCFALARWKVRRLLLGTIDQAPEPLPATMERFLILFALLTWIYRFVLYLGIAIMVYHLAFKLLGVVLMAVEVWWFILRPVWKEMSLWWGMRRSMTLKRKQMVAALLASLLAVGFVPWRSTLSAPALWQNSTVVRLYPPYAGRIEQNALEEGREVKRGEMLLLLSSPEVDYGIQNARISAGNMRWQIERQGAYKKFLESSKVLEKQHDSALVQLQGYQLAKNLSTIHAPVEGKIFDVADDLRPGRWIASDELLGIIAPSTQPMIEAYVEEADLSHIHLDGVGTFIPEDGDLPKAGLSVIRLDRVASRQLRDPSLASAYGGPIATVGGTHEKNLEPRDTVYRVVLKAATNGVYPDQTIRGKVHFSIPGTSLISFVHKAVMALLIRESGF